MLKSLSVRVKRTIKTVPTLQGVCFVVVFFLWLFPCLFFLMGNSFSIRVTDMESDQL